MTDDTTPELASRPADTDDLFVTLPAVPTAAWAHDIETRVDALEDAADTAPTPVGLTPEQETAIFTALKNIDGRLTRHREELEAIKEHQNQLGEYVEQHLPPTADPIPAAPAVTDPTVTGSAL